MNNIPLRGLMIVAVVVALGGAVSTTYVTSEIASVAAAMESSSSAAAAAFENITPTTTATSPVQSSTTGITQATPALTNSCAQGMHPDNGGACVRDLTPEELQQRQNPQLNQQPFDQGKQTQQNNGQQWQPQPGPQQCGPDGCPRQDGQNFSGQNNGPQQGGQGDQGDQQLKNMQREMKRWTKDLEQMTKQILNEVFDKSVKKAERTTSNLPEDIRASLQKYQAALDTVKNAKTEEELSDIDFRTFDEMRQEIDMKRNEVRNDIQQLQNVKQNLGNLEQQLKQFKGQLKKLKNVVVPQAISDAVAKVESLVTTIKNAKTWAEIEAVGGDDMWGAFRDLEEQRPQLEMLSRWPQTVKQLNSELKKLDSELKRSKAVVDRLAKKDIDLSASYDEFKAAIDALKAARDRATAEVNAGNAEEAFTILEEDVFGQMQEVWDSSRRIQIMNDLGKFASQSQSGIADAQKQIASLKRKKIDTATLEDLVNQAKEKRAEVIGLIKDKNVDPEDIFGSMQEMDEIRQQFEEQMSELTGQGEKRPWEEGPQQFNSIQVPKGWEGMMQQQGEPSGGQQMMNQSQMPPPAMNQQF